MTPEKKKKAKSSPLAAFVNGADSARRAEVYGRVIDEAIASQKSVMVAARSRKKSIQA